MQTIINYLKKLDFSETEAKLYITLLQKGSMTVSELAKKAKLNRTAAYGYINTLIDKGVIARSKGDLNKIIANPPEHLHYLVEERVSAANVLKEQLFPIVTTLNASFMQVQENKDSDIHYYKGKNSVNAIYNDCLKSQAIRAYFDVKDLEQTFPENKDKFNETITQNPKMIVYELIQKSPEAIAHIKNSLPATRHLFKFLPEDIKLTANDILIYEGKVAIINIADKNNVTGVVIHNKSYFENSKQIFDLLWRLLPEPFVR
ncbi:MAG: helix-turn-helix domain-containing protein [Candidatus Levybacteria bacterium]|nr:helix-turn-helix domain-containing protein [Candidatus Levybacteria bacterium]